jgi:hypothetical protein
MKGGIGKLGRPLSSKVLLCLAAVIPMFPSSASVLCIAPGGHIAIEDANALCCASSANFSRDERRPGSGLNMAGDCRNCTDYFLSLNERGEISKSYDAAAGSLVDDFLENSLLVIASSRLFRRSALNDVDASPPASSSAPLRC